MSSRVLLADDSATIQKVIKITLANEDYEIQTCEFEGELIGKVKEFKPELVLLDFGLSDSRSGYDLAKDIKEQNPNIRILMMYGTFDPVDENLLRDSGSSDKVIKPFDSTKFVSICNSLLEEFGLEEDYAAEDAFEPVIEEDEPTSIDEEDKTQDIDISALEPEEETAEDIEEEKVEALPERPALVAVVAEEIRDWEGMSVPNVIGVTEKGNDVLEDLPPVIASEEASEEEVKEVELDDKTDPHMMVNLAELDEKSDSDNLWEADEEEQLPVSDDLEFPDADNWQLDDESNKDDGFDPLSKLVPMDSLNNPAVNEVEKPVKPAVEESDDELLSMLDEDDDDLWVADNDPVSIVKETYTQDEATQEITLPKELNETVEPAATSLNVNSSDLENKIKQAVTPMLENLVKEYCRETIEKVAWDIIPDLAENLIQKELKRISDTVMND